MPGASVLPSGPAWYSLRTISRNARDNIRHWIAPTRSSSLLHLTRPAFICVWLSIVLTHALSGVYFGVVAYLHHYIIATELQTTIDILGGHRTAFIPWVLGSSVVIVVLHVTHIAWLGYLSVKHWQLALSSNSIAGSRPTSASKRSRITQAAGRLREAVAWLDVFSIHDAHHDVVFRLSKFVNGCAKFFQAWKLSRLVPTIWINRMYAVLLACSFFSTPLLNYHFRDHSILHRVMGLALDTLFDSIFLTIVPVAIFYSYAMSFGTMYGDFPIEFYYHDTWFIDAVAENQQLFVSSGIDFVTKHITALSVVVSLRELATCFVRLDNASVRPTGTLRLAGPSRKIASLALREPQPPDPAKRSTKSSTMFTRAMDAIFLVWGLLVTLIHIHATVVANKSPHPNCYLNLRPWFATSYHCAVLEVNCEVLQHDGDAANVSSALEGFDSDTLRALIITGCPSLEIPPRVQAFPQLQMLKIYNCTIIEWRADAALTATHHPALTLLYVVHTNFSDPTTLPAGLLSDDFPPSLQDIEFCGTNLVSLPMSLVASWKFIQFVVLENSPGITSFPLALVELGVPQLSLCGNGITSIADDLLVNQSFWSLSLNGNPLTSLPSTMGAMGDLFRLRLGYTGLSSLPSWMQPDSPMVAGDDTYEKVVDVKAGDTVVCDQLGKDVAASVLAAMTSEYFVLDCTLDQELHPRVLYPLEYEEELRQTRLERLRQS